MKNLKNLVTSVTFVLVLLLSLSSNSQSIFTEYENLGIIHNQFLSNAKQNFDISTSADSREQKIDIIKDFNLKFITKSDLNKNEKSILIDVLSEKKHYVDNISFYSNSFDRNNGIYFKLSELKENGTIDEFSFKSLEKLMVACENKNSIEELISLTNNLKKEANSYYKGTNNDKSRILAMSLQISSDSFDWWNKNRESFKKLGGQQNFEEDFFAVGWFAADAVGAVISAGIAAGGQYVTTGEVGNWGAVGISALGGAISASTGAVGRIAKWLGF